MEKLYSSIFVVDISQNPDEVETVASRVQQLIEDHGGVIKNIDRWGKRRLSYPIDGNTHGYYVEIEFNANSHLDIPQTLEDEYRLNDRVLRHLTYIVDKKELIQRARTSGKKEEEPKAKVEETRPESEKPSEESVSKEEREETSEIEEKSAEETSQKEEASVEEVSEEKSEKQE